MLTVHKCDGEREESVPEFGGFGVQCSVAPTRGEKLEQVMSRVRVISPARFLTLGGVQILYSGKIDTSNLFCRLDCLL